VKSDPRLSQQDGAPKTTRVHNGELAEEGVIDWARGKVPEAQLAKEIRSCQWFAVAARQDRVRRLASI
jgi:hypothetical protein